MTYSKDRTIFFSFKQKKDATSVTSFTEALACPTQRHKKVRPLLDAVSLQVLGCENCQFSVKNAVIATFVISFLKCS